MILNLGCGRDTSIPGAISVDISPQVHPSICLDLNQTPWPFQDGTFDVIYCKDILEHLSDVVKTMGEIHRVGKTGARVHVTTPHFSCSNSYTDPTHRQHLGFHSFDYFTEERKENWYTSVKFRKVQATLFFHPKWKNKLLWRLARAWPDFYEEHLTWIFPAWFLYFELEVIK